MIIQEKRIYYPNEVKNIISNICKEYNIILKILTEHQTQINGYTINRAYSTNNEIIISHFTLSPEYMLIAFFHELSHIINLKNFKQYNKFIEELNVSIFGINLAKDKYNIDFDNKVIKWLISLSFTYIK